MKIYHTINSGLIIMHMGSILWIDVLHKKSEGFSPVPAPFLSAMERGAYPASAPDGLVFTHRHPDHYDETLVGRLRARYPSMPCITPEQTDGVHNLGERGEAPRSLFIGNIELIPFPTKHDGPLYADVPHVSLIVRCGEESLLISGDAELKQEEEYREILRTYKPTCGFFNFFQLRRPAVRRWIQALKMRHVFLYHLGYPEDDKFHYIDQARRTIKYHPEILPAPKLLEPMNFI